MTASNAVITVTKKLNNGSPAEAENSLFQWSHFSSEYLTCKTTGRAIYQMAYMRKNAFGSDPIIDPTIIESIRKFWKALDAIKAESKIVHEKLETDRSDYINPRHVGLSTVEIDVKAQQWDEVINEGGEGFNPYR